MPIEQKSMSPVSVEKDLELLPFAYSHPSVFKCLTSVMVFPRRQRAEQCKWSVSVYINRESDSYYKQ